MKKTAKLCMALLLAFLLSISFMGITAAAEESFEGYTPVSTQEELDAIRDDLSGKYYLTADIELSGDWIPIGNGEDYLNAFSGVFDGNGHTISGLDGYLYSYSATEKAAVGLFGFVSGTVRDLHLKDGNVSGSASRGNMDTGYISAGSVAGVVTETGRIENCTNECSVYASTSPGHRSYAGGIVGINNGTVISCVNYGSVSGACDMGGIAATNTGEICLSSNHAEINDGCHSTFTVGGIVGTCKGVVSECYNTGSLGDSSLAASGGIAGFVENSQISDCFNAGNLTGNSGGIYYSCGGTKSSTSTIENCYNIGRAKYGIGSKKSSFYSSCTISNTYHLDNADYSIDNYVSSLYAMSQEEMMRQSSFYGYDFDQVWFMSNDGYPYPLLRSCAMDTSVTELKWSTEPAKKVYEKGETPDLSDGILAITSKNGITFETPVTADMVTGFDPNVTGKQTLSVVYGGKTLEFEIALVDFAGGTGAEGDPYLIATEQQLMCVRYNMGACYKLIADIQITDPDFRGIGGYSLSWDAFTGVFDGNGHTVSGLRIDEKVAPFYVNFGFIAYNEGTIKNLGLVDAEVKGTASDTYGERNFGGIAGYSSGVIENCFVQGTISGNNYSFNIGGIAGESEGTVRNCFTLVDVKGGTAGGICGVGDTIENCYSMGDNTFGICMDAGYVANCYYQVSTETKIGEGKYCTNEEMKTQATYAGFDFTDVWEMSDNVYFPYPVLRSVPFSFDPVSIEVKEAPQYVYYYAEAQAFVVHPIMGGVLSLVGENGAKLDVPMSGEMLTGNVLTVGGKQQLTLSCDGKTVSMETEVYMIDSGEGTEENPYVLKDKSGLYVMQLLSGAHYRLGADLIFDESDPVWTPIESFSGSLDGAGHRIEGLKIVGSTACVGLFGKLSGTVTRLGMVDCDVSTDIYATYNFIGGVAGIVEAGGSVRECYFAGKITAKGYENGRVGGIAGKVNSGAKVLDCYNLGTLNGMGMTYCWLGGVVAHNLGEVSRCYNAGFLSSKNPRGVVGYDEYSTITANYYLANGALSSSKAEELSESAMKNPDRFKGFDFDSVWVMRRENNYYYPELQAVPLHLNPDTLTVKEAPQGVIYAERTGAAFPCGGTVEITYKNGFKNTADMSGTEISGISAENGVQNVTFTLGSNVFTAQVPVYIVDSGSGTQADPFCISKKEHLQSMKAATDTMHFKLTKDLTFTDADFSEGGTFYNGGKLWEPIGVDYTDPFEGVFDGGNHLITGLKIDNNFGSNEDKAMYLGVFGYVSGTVKNLRLRNVDFQGTGRYGYVGGIAGGTSGTISDCAVESGRIVANVGSGFFRSTATAGGIVGITERGSIYGCRNAANIEAVPLSNYDTAHAAGIAGMMDGGSVTQCYNIGNATAILRMGGQNPVYAGGITAVISSGTVSDCFNTGISCGSYGNGGIAGLSYGTVTDCYNTAAIDRGTYGAIVGVQYGTVSGCYYLDNTTRGVGSGSGSTVQLTDSQMKKQASFTEFDFSNVWTMSGTEGYNYPELRSNTMLPIASITKQPSNVTGAKGESVSVKVSASGSGLTYRWYTKRAGASEFTETLTASSTYKCKMSSEVNGMQLYCVITDEFGRSVQTKTVTVYMEASIKTQPKTLYVQLDEKAKFSVKAEGEGLKYQWYYKSAGSSKYKKASSTKSSYSITMTEDRKDRAFYCVVTDKFGNKVQSKTVYMRLAASVKTEPKTAYVKLGDKAKFTVKAAGAGLKYQWYYKDADGKTYKKASSTKSSYSIEMTEDRKDRKFYCVITDKYGNSVKTKTVYMRMTVSIKTQPKSVTVKNGAKAKVKVKALGDGLTYTWYYKDPGQLKYKKSSNDSATYTAEMKSSRNGRKVYCIVKDKYGKTVQTKTVKLKKK